MFERLKNKDEKKRKRAIGWAAYRRHLGAKGLQDQFNSSMQPGSASCNEPVIGECSLGEPEMTTQPASVSAGHAGRPL